MRDMTTVHYRGADDEALCLAWIGSRGDERNHTDDPADVTCEECRAALDA